MIITCPNCRTRYQIDPATLGSRGRKVRCSSCGHRWLVEPFTESAAPPIPPAPPVPPPEPAAATPLASPPPETGGAVKPQQGNGLVGWLVLALIVLVLVAAVVGRNEVVAMFPGALSVYERLGLPVTVRLGLEFRDLASSRREGEGGGTVLVTGEIHNTTSREVRVPRLRVALLDARRAEIESGFFDPPQEVLPPEGSARFELDLADPPPEAQDFTITFADRP